MRWLQTEPKLASYVTSAQRHTPVGQQQQQKNIFSHSLECVVETVIESNLAHLGNDNY